MSLALISWQSVIAGAITTLAISIIMAILGVALGFTVVKPTSDKPLSGVGTAFSIWSAISIIISLAAGGLVAGIFSGVRGQEHGFMVWATVLIIAALFGGLAIGGAVRSVGTVVRGVGHGAVSAASTVGGGAAHMTSAAMDYAMDYAKDYVRDNVDLNFDADHIGEEAASVMRDTGIEHLQPEYLKDEMKKAKADLRNAFHQIRMNSENYEQIIDQFVDKQKKRLDAVTGDIDRNSAVTALMNARDMDRQEAEQTVDNALKVYHKAVNKTRASLIEARESLEDAKEHIKTMSDHARVRADRFASSAARTALAAGLALIVGAAVCSVAGWYGSRMAVRDSLYLEARTVAVPVPVSIPAGHYYQNNLDRSLDRPMGVVLERP